MVRVRPKRYTSSQPLRRILVLYPRRSSAYDTAITTFVNIIAEKRINAELTAVNFLIDDARGRAAVELAESHNYDLILSMGSESTAWLWTNYRGGKLPVVTVCSKDPVLLGQATAYDEGSGTNFAFTSLNMPIDAQMSYVLRLRPNLKNLAILVDANNISAVQTQAMPAADFLKTRGVRVLDVAVKNPAKVKEELAAGVRESVNTMRKNDVDLSNSLFWITGSTLLFSEIATINQHSFRVPVLSTVTEVVQSGDDSAVLSVGISFESNAHQAAIYAADVLDGRRAISSMHVGVASPPDVAISFRKAREIGMKIPFSLFESATTIFDNDGKLVRSGGASPTPTTSASPTGSVVQ
jgi:putative ABC transport system substrate-binding protein